MSTWSAADVPEQSGRTALVTGATSGLGLHTSLGLARRGARVLLGARNPQKGAATLAQVRAAATGPEPELVSMDLADLRTVRDAAEDVRTRTGGQLDLLVNNAGIMAPPLALSVDGFESQWATNHLGHAALTWLLLPCITATPAGRVVTVSSLAHRQGRISPVGLPAATHGEHYSPWAAYGRSKLANLLFAFELHRRLRIEFPNTLSVAAHPGLSSTGLVGAMMSTAPKAAAAAAEGVTRLLGQPAEQGALPQLYAATMPEVQSGQYYGPSWPGELRGGPKLVRPNQHAQDERLAKVIWSLTATQTGVEPAPSHVSPSGSSNKIPHG